MIDIKKMLYRYKDYLNGEKAAIESRNRVSKSYNGRNYPAGTAAYNDMIHGKGGLPFSSTERFALINLHSEESAKADPHWMEFDDRANGFREIIETIERAVNSLDETHQYLVYETYFNKKPIHYVLDKLNISPATYWRYHKIIMESLDVSFNKGNMVFTMMDVVPLKNDRKVIVNKRKSMIHC